jgi:type II secretory pathway component GspD/PulD (secretin)
MKPIIFTLFLLFSTVSQAVMEIITVNNRPASEVKTLLVPLLQPEDVVVANGANLIIRTSPERLGEIRGIISKLDTPLENLIITVAQGRNISADKFNAAANFKVHISNRDSYRDPVQVNARLRQTKSNSITDNTQTLRTLDGQPAYIKVGNVDPVQNIQYHPSLYGYPAISTQTQYIETSTGFAVTPRLTGNNQVILDIAPWSDKMGNNRQISTQGAHTTLQAKLGEWLEIGGNIENSQSTTRGILSEVRSTQTGNMHILIKIEKQ